MANANELARSPARSVVDPLGKGWQVTCGVLLIIVGMLAVLMPGIAALATALVFGWLMILSGIFELAYAIQTRTRIGFGWKLVSGILTLLLGIFLVAIPAIGVASLALMVGGFVLATGIARSALALRLMSETGWAWVLFDGLVSIVLAILILAGWPASSLAIIGLLTGFSLISSGIWRIMLAHRLSS